MQICTDMFLNIHMYIHGYTFNIYIYIAVYVHFSQNAKTKPEELHIIDAQFEDAITILDEAKTFSRKESIESTSLYMYILSPGSV